MTTTMMLERRKEKKLRDLLIMNTEYHPIVFKFEEPRFHE
jgi:hypothetical protein